MVENAKVGDIDALKIKTVCEGVGCGRWEWVFIKDNHFYNLILNSGINSTFTQILSTFTFINK